MVKLTKQIKENIFNSILADMPSKINYGDQIQELVWNDSFLQLPQELRDAMNNNKEIKNYLNVESRGIPDCSCMYLRSYLHYNMTHECRKEVIRLHALRDEQDAERNQIKENLWAVVDSCTTTENFIKNYPEFAGYVPKENQPIRNLPAVDLINKMKQTGWKEKQ